MGDRGGGKNDMDRIGVFQEMGYVTIGDRYKPPGSKYCVEWVIVKNTSDSSSAPALAVLRSYHDLIHVSDKSCQIMYFIV